MTIREQAKQYALRKVLLENSIAHNNPFNSFIDGQSWTEWNIGYNTGFCEATHDMSVDDYKRLTADSNRQLTFF